jgi:antitoxin (DNA-binding transcriptional repressor) of toxin-antitoxin stability system
MSSFISLEEAQARLPEVIARLIPGQQLFITNAEGHIVARLIGEAPPPEEPIQPGSAKGKILYMADDFDAPLEDFKEYMG